MKQYFSFGFLLICFLFFPENNLQAQQPVSDQIIYEVVELGGVFSSYVRPNSINNESQIVGWGRVNNGVGKSYIWEDGEVTDFGFINIQRDVRVNDINNIGEAVGMAETFFGEQKGYLWKDSNLNIKTIGEIFAINDDSEYASASGVWKDDIKISNLPALQAGRGVYPHAMNTQGYVVGRALTYADQPVYWINGSVFQIINTNNGIALDVNNQNQIVGFYNDTIGFLWENGSIVRTFPGQAVAITETGTVLIQQSGVSASAIWSQSDGLRYLNELVDDLPVNFIVIDINDNGDILGLSENKTYLINKIAPTNTAPTFTPINTQTTTEGTELTFTISATDEDNDPITYSVTNLPSGATLDPQTGVFSWTPGYNDAGSYEVTFTATEDTETALFDSETITITVNNSNRAPVLTPIGNQLITEGATLQFTVTATDEDNDTVTLSATNLPSGATFTPSTGVFFWNTDYNDAGNYPDIEFTATDNGIPIELDVEFITITVGDVNRAPEITNPGPQTVQEEDSLSFSVSATDPDGDSTTLTATNLPSGATWSGTTFSWTPDLSDEGIYTVTITVTDTGTPAESTSIDVVITVGNNPTPVEQAQDLIDIVTTIDIPQNVENSYLANLKKVEQFILDGKITPALNQLTAFKNKVQQDYQQGILTQAEYQQLIDAANDLIDDLNS